LNIGIVDHEMTPAATNVPTAQKQLTQSGNSVRFASDRDDRFAMVTASNLTVGLYVSRGSNSKQRNASLPLCRNRYDLRK